jgi:hypothetical protein
MNEPLPPVSIRDIDIPFVSMVRFMVKWAIAAIPALVILTMLGALLWGLIIGIVAPLSRKATDASVDSRPTQTFPVSPLSTEPTAKPVLALLNATSSYVGVSETSVVGQAQNIGSEPLEAVVAIVIWTGPAGNFVMSDNALVSTDPLPPGQTSRFQVTSTGVPPGSTFHLEFAASGGALTFQDRRK